MIIKQRCFSLLKNQKKQLFNLNKLSYTMKTQKIINFLNDSSNEKSKFAGKKWYVLDIQTKKINTSKAILLNLKQKLLNQVFVIILMHLFKIQEI